MFVAFLDWLAARTRDTGRAWQLVILGDFLDLLHRSAASPAAALEAVAAAHPAAFSALGRHAATGTPIAIVPGNHDSELLDRSLQRRFVELVGELSGAPTVGSNLTFHPWFYLIPGLVYAEHGSQYHALNAVRNPLVPAGRWSPTPPIGALLAVHSAMLGEQLAERRAGAVGKALVAGSVSARLAAASTMVVGRRVFRGRRHEIREELRRQASSLGIAPETALALAELSQRSVRELLRGAACVLTRQPSRVQLLQEAAACGIHELLLAEGKAAPVYVFGHTHAATVATARVNGSTIRCFNSGAWLARAQRSSTASAPTSYPFVEISRHAGGAVAAELRQWDPDRRTAIGVRPVEHAIAN